MSWNRDIVSVITIFSGCFVMLWYTPIVWRERKKLDKRKAAFFAIGCCASLGAINNLDKPYLWIGQISHIPNLSWLMSFLILVMGHYWLRVLMSEILHADSFALKTFAYITVAFMIFQTLLFFLGGIASSPLIPVRTSANTLSELIFINALFVFQIIILFTPWISSLKMFFNNRALELKIRSGMFFVVLSSGIIYSVLRIFQTVVVDFLRAVDTTPINGILKIVLWFTFAIALSFWPLVALPSRWFSSLQQIQQLYHLNYLYRRISDDCGESLSISPPHLWAQIRQATFYTNAIIVFILDVKWLTKHNRSTIRDRNLEAVIETLDDALPQKQFIAECVKQSRHLKHQKHTSIGRRGIEFYG